MSIFDLRGRLTKRTAGNSVLELPGKAFEEAVSNRNGKEETRVKERADKFDHKLRVTRSKMKGKGEKAKKSHGFLITVRNWAIGIGLVIYAYLFLQFGPILLGCTLALVVVGGLVFLFFKFRPKDDPEEGE